MVSNKYGRDDLFELFWNFPVNIFSPTFLDGSNYLYGINDAKIYKRSKLSCDRDKHDLAYDQEQFRSYMIFDRSVIATTTNKDVVIRRVGGWRDTGTKCPHGTLRGITKDGIPRFYCTEGKALKSYLTNGTDEIEHTSGGLFITKLEVVGLRLFGILREDQDYEDRKNVYDICIGERPYCQQWQKMYVGQEIIVDITTFSSNKILGLVKQNGDVGGNKMEIKILERTHFESGRRKRDEF